MKMYFIFCAHFLPYLGGVERYSYNLAKVLINKGNKVTIITSNTDRAESYEVIENIEIFRLPCFNVLNGRFPVLKLNFEFFRIKKELIKKVPNFFIINTRFYIHSLFGVCFAKQLGIPSIVIEHGTGHFTVNNFIFDTLGHIYEHLITGLIRNRCRNFYGVSQACEDWLRHFKIHAKGVLYNAIDVKEIQNILAKPVKNYRQDFEIPDDSFVVTYTGRLVAEKGILKLISAIEKLNEKYPNIYLFIAGAGELFDAVQRLKSKNIIVLGKIDFEHVVSLLKQTDIFCLPTDYPEGFPTSILEAAACKCYIITTLSGGSKELIINNDCGMILENNTVDSIAQGIVYAIKNKTYRIKAVNLAYQRLTNVFTWDKTGDRVIKLAEGDSL